MTNTIAPIYSQDIIAWYLYKAPNKTINTSLAETCAGFIEKVLDSYTSVKERPVKSVRFELKKIFPSDDNNVFFFQFATPDLIKKHALMSIELTKYSSLNQKNCLVIYLKKSVPTVHSLEGLSHPTSTNTDKVSDDTPLKSNSPEKNDRDVLRICSQDVLNWYTEKAPNRQIDATLAEKCAGIVEEVLQLYTRKNASQIVSLELNQIFADSNSSVFFFQYVIPDLIHDHVQKSIMLKRHYSLNNNRFVIIYSQDAPSPIPKLGVSIHLPIDTKNQFLDIATSVANEFLLKCLEQPKEKEKCSITIQSSTIFPGKSDIDILKNCEFYLYTLPKILENKGIIILDASTQQISAESHSFFITTLQKFNANPILKQFSDMFDQNAEEGFYAIIKRCRPIYEGQSDEIILKNSEFYAVTLPKKLESRNIFLRDVVVQYISAENEYLIQYYRKTESLYWNKSTQKQLDFAKTPEVNVEDSHDYSKLLVAPHKEEFSENEEAINTTSDIFNSPPRNEKNVSASKIDMKDAQVRVFSRGLLQDPTSTHSKPNIEIKTHLIRGEENKIIIESKEQIPNKN